MKLSVLYNVAKQLELGKVISKPTRIYGGFLHISYKLVTDKSSYMIKCFGKNNGNSLQGFFNKERLEEYFKQNNIPAVYPIKFNDRGIQQVDGELIYVFPFIKAKSLDASEMTIEQLKQVALVLANIHSIKIEPKNISLKPINIDWNKYLDIAKKTENSLVYDLEKLIPVLNELMQMYNLYIAKMPNIATISHNDMDCKNILWNEAGLNLIDLECIGYNNPYYEAYKYALVYAGYEEASIDIEKVKIFLSTYFDNVKLKLDRTIEPEILYYASGLNLEWLEFSLKRAFKLVGNTKTEQQLGIEQSQLCFREISHFYNMKDLLINLKF